MKNILAIICSAILGLALLIGLAACSSNQTSTPPGATLPTPESTSITQEAGQKIALDFVRNSATFKFDGIANSLKVTSSDYGPISSYHSFAYTIEFQTAHPGHGDRTGHMLSQVITLHSATVIVNAEKGAVGMGACDRTWDLLNGKILPTFVSGFVIGGGDTTPADGPRDAPRQFIFQVQKDDGTRVDVAYAAYPPSPVGDANRAKIGLDFYQTPVQLGDYLEAQGVMDAASITIHVSGQGDFIRTFQRSSIVRGTVVSGGDTTPAEGPLDVPRIFVYKLKKDDSGFVEVTYTAYPPSPVGEANRAKIMFSLYAGQIKIGDYLKAQGFYDPAAGTLTVGQQGDFIKTYPPGSPVD
jgi:hypothetical protein